MKIFELYFNPKNKDKLCESFYYDPESVYHRRVGRIYMIGELSDAKPTESSFLANIFHIIKEKYYENPSLSPDKALKETLKEVNEAIEENGCKERVSMAIISSKNFLVHVGKIGGAKIFLLTEGKMVDIGKELEIGGSRLFRNIVSGKMKKNDKIIALTPDIYHPFSREKILEDMTSSIVDEKYMEKISSLQKQKFPDTSGVSLVIDYSMNIKEGSRVISSETENFSFKKTFAAFLTSFHSKAVSFFQKREKVLKKISLPSMPQIKKLPNAKNKLITLPFILIIVIVIGTVFISIEERSRENKQRESLSEVVKKLQEGESRIEQGDTESAFFIFENALNDLYPIMSKRTRILGEMEEVKNNIKGHLYSLSSRENAKNITLIAKIDQISPEQMILSEEKIYLFSSTSNEMVVVNTLNEEQKVLPMPISDGVSLSSASINGGLLFSNPDTLIYMENGKLMLSQIEPPYEKYSFSSLSSFIGRAYLFERERGEILFYGGKKPSIWIREGEKRFIEGKDIAIDGSIFVLDKQNGIQRYYTGHHKEEIKFFIHPSVSDIKRVYTSQNTPLFLLEPSERRVIILDKEGGGVIRQVYYEDFEDIKDIAISSDGKKIYLLNDKKVYLFEL